MKELELVHVFANGYKHSKLAAIDTIIRHIDAPMVVRCDRFGAATANAAYFDMMLRTRKQFLNAHILDSFYIDDINSGDVAVWLTRTRQAMHKGKISIGHRMYNGRDVFSVRSCHRMTGGWLVTAFDLSAEFPIVLPEKRQEVPRSFHTAYTHQPQSG